MKQLITIFIIFICCTQILSCGSYSCGKASATIGLTGFSDSESNPIIFRRFIKGSNFTSLQDSFVVTKLNANFQKMHDTLLILHSNADGNNDILSDYDYEIFIYKANRIYRLTEIIEAIRYGKNNGQKIYCINPITSYKLNGQLIPGTDYNFIYLKK